MTQPTLPEQLHCNPLRRGPASAAFVEPGSYVPCKAGPEAHRTMLTWKAEIASEEKLEDNFPNENLLVERKVKPGEQCSSFLL